MGEGEGMKGWDSRRVIGEVRRRYSEWDTRSMRNPTGRNLYAAFYNGWLEGRLDMLRQMEGPRETFGSIDTEPFRREE